jgi:CheY-specific phosphatase CheX
MHYQCERAQFWEQMLAMTLEPVEVAEEFRVCAGHLVGCVRLSGKWTGRVEVRMAEALAYEATAAMLMLPVASVEMADTLDATREIANMIAGIIKCPYPGRAT